MPPRSVIVYEIMRVHIGGKEVDLHVPGTNLERCRMQADTLLYVERATPIQISTENFVSSSRHDAVRILPSSIHLHLIGEKRRNAMSNGEQKKQIVSTDRIDGDKLVVSYSDETTSVYTAEQLSTLIPQTTMKDNPDI
jgi:hypothetical protein